MWVSAGHWLRPEVEVHRRQLVRHVVALTFAAVLVGAAGASARPAPTVLLYIHTGGAVLGSPGNFVCSGRCAIPLRRGSLATLRALPRANFRFSHWLGDCIGTAPTCSVALDHDQSIRALYQGRDVGVVMTVGGPGEVRSVPAGIDCGAEHDDCSATFPWGTRVRFVPSGTLPDWGAACWNVGTGACTLTLHGLTSVIVAFTHESTATTPQVLTVLRAFRRVTSTPEGIHCPGVCQATFPAGTRVLLNQPDGQWGGDCVGEVLHRCPLVLDGPVTVSVLPPKPPPSHEVGGATYGVNVTVSGRGAVTAPGIKCDGTSGTLYDCQNYFSLKQVVVLKAKAARHAQFVGWSQFCGQYRKKQRCTLIVASTATVGAAFRSEGGRRRG